MKALAGEVRSMQRPTISWNAILLRQAPQSSHGYKVAANLLLHTSEDSMKSQGSAGHLSTEKLSAWCQQKSPHHGFYCINIISPTLAPLFYNGSHVLLSTTVLLSGYSDHEVISNCSPLFSVPKPPWIKHTKPTVA